MTPRHRFGVWVVAAAAPVAAAPARRLETDLPWAGAGVVQALALVVMFLLLARTPQDAIRLDRRTSWALIVAGAALIGITTGSLVAGLFLAVALPLACGATVLNENLSPWWVTLVAWNPAVPMMIRPAPYDLPVAAGVAFALLLIVPLWVIVRHAPDGERPRPLATDAVVLLVVSLACGVSPLFT